LLLRRAIENGANFIAEGFLFTVAAGLILGETWRTSRNQSKRRDDVDDQLDALGTKVVELSSRLDAATEQWQNELDEERAKYVFLPTFGTCPSKQRSDTSLRRNNELSRILERIVEIGMRGGWAEFEATPLQIPRIQLTPHHLPAFDENTPRTVDIDTESDTNIRTPPNSKPESSSSLSRDS
jgi:hypothetical protein